MTDIRDLCRKSWLYFSLFALAALGLRLLFVFHLPVVTGDALFYGDLAKNWLRHGILGTTELHGIAPSLIRLPGYPAFLAAIWAIAGIEHYGAVLLTQAVIDVFTCFLVADLTLRTTRSERAARIAFLLAALCPFTANYTACALAETLSIFFATLALDMAAAAMDSGRISRWAACGAALGAGLLLRPDNGILMAVVLGYVVLRPLAGCMVKGCSAGQATAAFRQRLPGIIVLISMTLAPLVPWTVRNWHTFHVFQPIAPRYANNPGQFVPVGFQRWVKTWMADYVSVAEIYWVEGSEPLEITKLPNRAFDNPQERALTASLFDTYNTGKKALTPELDRQFGALAGERIRRHPVRYYVTLPALRIADMWLRPRTEMLGLTDHWWEYRNDPEGSRKAIAVGVLNLLFLATALVAVLKWIRQPSGGRYWGMLLAFVAVRSLFLGSLENPEPRYTLECYTVVIVLAAAVLTGAISKRPRFSEAHRSVACNNAE
jgi:hypothetical protein